MFSEGWSNASKHENRMGDDDEACQQCTWVKKRKRRMLPRGEVIRRWAKVQWAIKGKFKCVKKRKVHLQMLAKANMLYKANYQNDKAAQEDQGVQYTHTARPINSKRTMLLTWWEIRAKLFWVWICRSVASKSIVDANLFGFCEVNIIYILFVHHSWFEWAL